MKTLVLPVICAAMAASALAQSNRVGGGPITLKVSGASAVTFSHELHVAAVGLGCRECHTKLFTTRARHVRVSMAAMQKGGSCGACHDGTKAFAVNDRTACANCHVPAERR